MLYRYIYFHTTFRLRLIPPSHPFPPPLLLLPHSSSSPFLSTRMRVSSYKCWLCYSIFLVKSCHYQNRFRFFLSLKLKLKTFKSQRWRTPNPRREPSGSTPTEESISTNSLTWLPTRYFSSSFYCYLETIVFLVYTMQHLLQLNPIITDPRVTKIP